LSTSLHRGLSLGGNVSPVEWHNRRRSFNVPDGRGGTHWASARPNTTERIVLDFEPPQHISHLVYEVEECCVERTQEVRVEVSMDHGRTYRQVLAQDYTFSPQGATFQHEELQLDLGAITNLSLTIVPNKGGAGVASLTSLRLLPLPTESPMSRPSGRVRWPSWFLRPSQPAAHHQRRRPQSGSWGGRGPAAANPSPLLPFAPAL
jgi:F5/8 type C domain